MAGFIVALTGAHGSGKSTIAAPLAAKLGVPYVASKASQVHRAFGIAPAEHVGLQARLAIQEAILEQFLIDLNTARKTGAVFDRSPLDFAAYLLADVRRDADPTLSEAISLYVRRCIKFTDELDCVLLCRPHGGIVQDRGDDKVDGAGAGYVDHIDLLIVGMSATLDEPPGVLMPARPSERLADAIDHVNTAFNRGAQKYVERNRGG